MEAARATPLAGGTGGMAEAMDAAHAARGRSSPVHDAPHALSQPRPKPDPTAGHDAGHDSPSDDSSSHDSQPDQAYEPPRARKAPAGKPRAAPKPGSRKRAAAAAERSPDDPSWQARTLLRFIAIDLPAIKS